MGVLYCRKYDNIPFNDYFSGNFWHILFVLSRSSDTLKGYVAVEGENISKAVSYLSFSSFRWKKGEHNM